MTTNFGEKCLWCIVCFPFCLYAGGQQADSLQRVHTIYVGSLGAYEGARDLMRELAESLKRSHRLSAAQSPETADAVIVGRGELWIRAYHSLSPRARANPASAEPVYAGYLSVKVEGKDGEVLWSYLATPPRVSLTDLKRQLANQVVNKLVEAIESAGAPPPPPAISAAALPETLVTLNGAGATFPYPIYQDWFRSFQARHPSWRFYYRPVGSEAGVGQLLNGDADFAGSDIAPAATPALKTQGVRVFPSVGGGVAIIYNLPRLEEDLQLTPDAIAGIFAGRINTWNDPALRATNRHNSLPPNSIKVVHRAEGSGTTFAFTDYLTKVNSEWRQSIGAGARVNWPTGAGMNSNEGVAQFVNDTPFSVGYVEFVYAFFHHLRIASVENASGRFVRPDLASISAAANSAAAGENAFSVSLANSNVPAAYPIATFSWLIFKDDLPPDKRRAMTSFVAWMLTSGQKECSALGYAPLPPSLVARELEALK